MKSYHAIHNCLLSTKLEVSLTSNVYPALFSLQASSVLSALKSVRLSCPAQTFRGDYETVDLEHSNVIYTNLQVGHIRFNPLSPVHLAAGQLGVLVFSI